VESARKRRGGVYVSVGGRMSVSVGDGGRGPEAEAGPGREGGREGGREEDKEERRRKEVKVFGAFISR